jgi:hypothetical protein
MEKLMFLIKALLGGSVILALLILVAVLSIPMFLLCRSLELSEDYLTLSNKVGEKARDKFRVFLHGSKAIEH